MGKYSVNSKGIRVMFIVGIYNIIASIIAFVINYTIKWSGVDWENWAKTDWWLFFAVLIMIGVFMLYQIPYFDAWLEEKLDYQLEKLKNKGKVERNNEKQENKEAKKQELQAKKSVDKVYGDVPE